MLKCAVKFIIFMQAFLRMLVSFKHNPDVFLCSFRVAGLFYQQDVDVFCRILVFTILSPLYFDKNLFIVQPILKDLDFGKTANWVFVKINSLVYFHDVRVVFDH